MCEFATLLFKSTSAVYNSVGNAVFATRGLMKKEVEYWNWTQSAKWFIITSESFRVWEFKFYCQGFINFCVWIFIRAIPGWYEYWKLIPLNILNFYKICV